MMSTMTLPEKVRLLDVNIGGERRGELLQQSQLLFKYLRDDTGQSEVALLMPPTRLLYQSNSLFPVMDQNLPEGFLLQRIREAFPKQPLTGMHLLALIGENGIGSLGFHLPGVDHPNLSCPCPERSCFAPHSAQMCSSHLYKFIYRPVSALPGY